MMESFISNDGEQFIVLILTAIPTSPKFTISTLSYLAIWDIFYNDINQQRTMRYHKSKANLKLIQKWLKNVGDINVLASGYYVSGLYRHNKRIVFACYKRMLSANIDPTQQRKIKIH